MNPTPGMIASIKTFVAGLSGGFAGNTDAQIRAAMASTKVANPLPQATVPTPFTYGQLLGLLSAGSQANLEAFPAIHDLFAAILAQNAADVVATVQLMQDASKITSAEATAITNAVNATGPDPNWTAQVGWDVANIRPSGADDFDIEAARHS